MNLKEKSMQLTMQGWMIFPQEDCTVE